MLDIEWTLTEKSTWNFENFSYQLKLENMFIFYKKMHFCSQSNKLWWQKLEEWVTKIRIAEKTCCSAQTWCDSWTQWEITEDKRVPARWYRTLRTCFIKSLQRLRELTRCLQCERIWSMLFLYTSWTWQSSRQWQQKHRMQSSVTLRCWRWDWTLQSKQCSNKLNMKSWFYNTNVCLLTEKKSNWQKLWKSWTWRWETMTKKKW